MEVAMAPDSGGVPWSVIKETAELAAKKEQWKTIFEHREVAYRNYKNR